MLGSPLRYRGNREFLLRPIDVRDAVARWRFDQAANPDRRSEDELRVAWLIAARAGAERRQHRAITPVAADGEIIEPQLGQRTAQLAQRRDRPDRLWPSRRNVSSERSRLPLSRRGQGISMPNEVVGEAVGAEAAAVVDTR